MSLLHSRTPATKCPTRPFCNLLVLYVQHYRTYTFLSAYPASIFEVIMYVYALTIDRQKETSYREENNPYSCLLKEKAGNKEATLSEN